MIYRGFCGPSNPSQSVLADIERTVNFYTEKVESPAAPTGAALFPTPGQSVFVGFTAGITDVGTRALFSMNGRCFAIVGGGFYELFSTQVAIKRGTVAQDTNPATICANGPNGNQLGITSGGNWYNYDLGTNTLTQVAALTGKATMGGMKDGFFLCFNVLTGTVFVSNINDGTTWTTVTQFFQRTIAPDPWRAMVVGNPYIYMLGEQTSEAWYNAGNSPQPFAPILSSFMQHGTPAPFAAQMAEDALVFLSRDKNGQGLVMAARGYVPQPLSNYAVETAIQRYARTSTINDAELMVYQDQGHLFGVFGFPSGNATWATDVNGGALWHERGTWNAPNDAYDAWHPRVHCYAFGLHLVGDRGTGNINSMDVATGTEADGSIIRRLRIGPPLWAASEQRLQIDRFQLQVDPGLGLPSGQGSDPKVMLRCTTNGQTWSHERQASAGALGQYGRRVYWTRLGSSTKLWAPEISVSDPIPWRFTGAEIVGRGFQQAKQRAA